MQKLTLEMLINLCFLFLVSCSKGHSIPGDQGALDALKNKEFFETVGRVRPLNPKNQYAAKMQECIYADTEKKSCKVSDLPLLGLDKNKITIQDILDRTLVSHDFLAVAFREVLFRMPKETLQMFGSITAVVISDKINPSFFYANTGAIYISGRYLWSNKAEWDIVSGVQDSRESAGFLLQYIFDHDYIKNGKSISKRAKNAFQTYDEMAPKTARVLFHELTHANDYFPRAYYSKMVVEDKKSYIVTAYDHYDNKEIASQNLPSKLISSKLTHIADVLYFGSPATTTDQATLAEEVISEFRSDLATDLYSYSNHFEDLAMCAEEALMLYYYHMPRFIVVIKLPGPKFNSPENYVYEISWGVKSRVADVAIKNRAVFAVENDLGVKISQQVSDHLDTIQPKEIQANTSWDDVYAL